MAVHGEVPGDRVAHRDLLLRGLELEVDDVRIPVERGGRSGWGEQEQDGQRQHESIRSHVACQLRGANRRLLSETAPEPCASDSVAASSCSCSWPSRRRPLSRSPWPWRSATRRASTPSTTCSPRHSWWGPTSRALWTPRLPSSPRSPG